MEQRSPEWFAARCGSLGASQINDALAKTKSGWGAGRKNLIAQLVAERLSGNPSNSFCSAAMQWGIEMEDEAREVYEAESGEAVITCGLFKHPVITGTHASPDGLIDKGGLVEIKCPNTATHIDYLLGDVVPAKYINQMMWQMACTGRNWNEFVSYDPRMPDDLTIFIKRLDRDDEGIAALEEKVSAFLEDVAELEKKVRHLAIIRGGF